MDEDLDIKIRATRAVMIKIFPMFGLLASKLLFFPDKTGIVPTFGVNKYGVVLYNPKFAEKLEYKELLFVLAHEAMHYALEIFKRMEGADPTLVNIAHDYVVNGILSAYNKIKIIEGTLLNDKYSEWSVEEVYMDIKEQQQQSGGALSGDITISDEAFNESVPDGAVEKITDKELSEKIKQAWREAIQADKELDSSNGWGSLPNAVKQKIDDLIFPKITFEEKLKQFFGRWGRKTKRSYAKPNRRNSFQPYNMLRPGTKRNSPKIYILIDTSGSMMGDAGVRKGLGTVLALSEQCGLEVQCMTCDTEVKDIMNAQEIRAQLIANSGVSLTGWGGSDFRPAFERIWHESFRPAPIIVFTDGYIDVPEKCKPGWGVYWVTNHLPTLKWGELMEL